VRSKLPTPELAEFKVGFFPDSAEGLEEDFCFVSLDADLYEPTLEGLRYFYARLNPGGYIMVHDYASSRYHGATKAVIDFSAESGVSFVPIPDMGGTAVFCKSSLQ
jgi:O-methyltransferase